MLVAHLQQLAFPAPEATADEPAPAPALVPPLAARDVLAAERFPSAVAAPGTRHWPDGADSWTLR
ncbi:hypothetical protein [Streptomyces sp. NPDC048002]|uniref:hypothetical protein n=1 Tax=Streptomyces sp. NPDC048002 TaxID=3154344 RepID=UPI0033F3A3EA